MLGDSVPLLLQVLKQLVQLTSWWMVIYCWSFQNVPEIFTVFEIRWKCWSVHPGGMLPEKVINTTSFVGTGVVILEQSTLSSSLKCWEYKRLNNIASLPNVCQVLFDMMRFVVHCKATLYHVRATSIAIMLPKCTSWKCSLGRLHTRILPLLTSCVSLDSSVRSTMDHCLGGSMSDEVRTKQDKQRETCVRWGWGCWRPAGCLEWRYASRILLRIVWLLTVMLFVARRCTLVAFVVGVLSLNTIRTTYWSFCTFLFCSWTPRPSDLFHSSGVDKTISQSLNDRVSDCKSHGNLLHWHTFLESHYCTPSVSITKSSPLKDW